MTSKKVASFFARDENRLELPIPLTPKEVKLNGKTRSLNIIQLEKMGHRESQRDTSSYMRNSHFEIAGTK